MAGAWLVEAFAGFGEEHGTMLQYAHQYNGITSIVKVTAVNRTGILRLFARLAWLATWPPSVADEEDASYYVDYGSV
jgi:hypothetical protein